MKETEDNYYICIIILLYNYIMIIIMKYYIYIYIYIYIYTHIQVHLKTFEYPEKGQYFSLISESETHILYRFITYRVKYFKPLFLEIWMIMAYR